MEKMTLKLRNELDDYIDERSNFTPYYEGMNIVFSSLYKKQLQEIEKLLETDKVDVKYFKMYLDTIIINMHTKAKKYKQSVYFQNEDINIKDIDNQGYTIVFYSDEKKNIYVLLGIIKKS